MPTRDDQERIWPRWPRIAFALLAMFYVLSIGPAYRLQIHSSHWPLEWVGRFAVPGTLLASYVNLWLPSKDRAIYAPHFGIVVIEGNSLE